MKIEDLSLKDLVTLVYCHAHLSQGRGTYKIIEWGYEFAEKFLEAAERHKEPVRLGNPDPILFPKEGEDAPLF